MDEFLEKRIQNWAATRKPPAHGKLRLLRSARQIAYFQSKAPASTLPREPSLLHFWKTGVNRRLPREYSHQFFDWTIVYSFELSLVNLKLMY